MLRHQPTKLHWLKALLARFVKTAMIGTIKASQTAKLLPITLQEDRS